METRHFSGTPQEHPQWRSPFGGIPRNWKRVGSDKPRKGEGSSPFGGIPRNWKQREPVDLHFGQIQDVPPSGGSLEIGNQRSLARDSWSNRVPPSGGSLEIGNLKTAPSLISRTPAPVPPSGGSLEIGNHGRSSHIQFFAIHDCSPFGGIPRNWKQD